VKIVTFITAILLLILPVSYNACSVTNPNDFEIGGTGGGNPATQATHLEFASYDVNYRVIPLQFCVDYAEFILR
jgi:hypothetical protein